MPRKKTTTPKTASKTELSKEIAGPLSSPMRTIWQQGVASGLTPFTLASILEKADTGYPSDFFALAEEMEEREAHYRSVLQTRKLSLCGLSYLVQPSDESPEAISLAMEVQQIINDAPFRHGRLDLLDGIAKGVSVVEIIWDTTKFPWTPVDFIWQDPRWFKYDDKTGRELLLVTDAEPNGEPMSYGKFLIHEPNGKSGLSFRGGLARTAAFLYLVKSYAVKDWVSFCEVFGFPLRIGKHAPTATDDEREALLKAIRQLGTNATAVIPSTMILETHDGVAASRGEQLFGQLVKWVDEQISKLVLGQTMTADNGSSLAQATVHENIRQEILYADAQSLADTINNQLIKPYVEFNYGFGVKPPLLSITQGEVKDLKLFSEAITPFIDRGLKVSSHEISNMFGLKTIYGDDEILGPQPQKTGQQTTEPNPSPKNA